MQTHDLHGFDVSIHENAKGVKDFLKAEPHLARSYFKDVDRRGKAHFEFKGKKFTVVRNDKEEEERGTYYIRPRNE